MNKGDMIELVVCCYLLTPFLDLEKSKL